MARSSPMGHGSIRPFRPCGVFAMFVSRSPVTRPGGRARWRGWTDDRTGASTTGPGAGDTFPEDLRAGGGPRLGRGRWSSVAIVDTTRVRPAGVLVPGPQVPPTTVIVPTRNESGNVRELLRRLVPSLPTGSEVLFVDDSDDDTVQVIEAAAVGLPVRVRVHHREVDDRADGLGGAVRAGLEGAGCEWCVVMDADLQHPPELVPQLVEAGVAPTASSSWRAGTAVWAGMLPAQPRPSGPVLVGHSSDKGFFPDGSPTCPTPCRILRGSPIVCRRVGPSPARLQDPPRGRCALWAAAHRSGALPLRGALQRERARRAFARCARLVRLLTRLWADTRSGGRWRDRGLRARRRHRPRREHPRPCGSPRAWAAPTTCGAYCVATLVSTTWNWGLLEVLVYPSGARRSAARRLAALGAVNLVALVLRVPLLALLIDRLNVNYLLANLFSLVMLFAARFVVSDLIHLPEAHHDHDRTSRCPPPHPRPSRARRPRR